MDICRYCGYEIHNEQAPDSSPVWIDTAGNVNCGGLDDEYLHVDNHYPKDNSAPALKRSTAAMFMFTAVDVARVRKHWNETAMSRDDQTVLNDWIVSTVNNAMEALQTQYPEIHD